MLPLATEQPDPTDMWVSGSITVSACLSSLPQVCQGPASSLRQWQEEGECREEEEARKDWDTSVPKRHGAKPIE